MCSWCRHRLLWNSTIDLVSLLCVPLASFTSGSLLGWLWVSLRPCVNTEVSCCSCRFQRSFQWLTMTRNSACNLWWWECHIWEMMGCRGLTRKLASLGWCSQSPPSPWRGMAEWGLPALPGRVCLVQPRLLQESPGQVTPLPSAELLRSPQWPAVAGYPRKSSW